MRYFGHNYNASVSFLFSFESSMISCEIFSCVLGACLFVRACMRACKGREEMDVMLDESCPLLTKTSFLGC